MGANSTESLTSPVHYSSSDGSTRSVPLAVTSSRFISINSGLEAGELRPVLHNTSRLLVVITHALYSAPEFTVTLGMLKHIPEFLRLNQN
jgi:hypothetical protein